jgi:hypothetical protein
MPLQQTQKGEVKATKAGTKHDMGGALENLVICENDSDNGLNTIIITRLRLNMLATHPYFQSTKPALPTPAPVDSSLHLTHQPPIKTNMLLP